MQSEAVEAAQRTTPESAGQGRIAGFARRRGTDPAAAFIAALVAQRRNIPVELLLHRHRCRPEIAGARMLAMYLTHVLLGWTYSDVGGFFGRDRTTVAHACARIEDLRDEPRFEDEIAAFERAIGAAAGNSPESRHAAG